MAIDSGQCVRTSTQIESEMDGLGNALSRLEEASSRLADRLCTVVTQEGTNPCAPGCPKAALVPLAETIRVSRDRVDGLTDRVLSLLNRLEL